MTRKPDSTQQDQTKDDKRYEIGKKAKGGVPSPQSDKAPDDPNHSG